jgi:hypothetical protein
MHAHLLNLDDIGVLAYAISEPASRIAKLYARAEESRVDIYFFMLL